MVDFVGENDNTFDLSAFDEDISTTEAIDPFAPVPNGNYNCRIEKVYMAKSKSDNDMLKWEFRVIGGPVRGQMLFNNSMLMSPKNMQFLKNELVTICGLTLSGSWASLFKPWTDNEEQPPELAGLIDIYVTVSVKNKPDSDFPNIRLIKRIPTPVESAETGTF